MQGIAKPLLIARIITVGLAYACLAASAPTSSYPPYHLIHQTDSTTDQTGSLLLQCRDTYTGNMLAISGVSFFLNRSSADDLSLRQRGDITVTEVGHTSIKFNLTRQLEGNYTCATRTEGAIVKESPPKTLVCKY